MSEQAAPSDPRTASSKTGSWRFAGALKLALVTAFLFITGGPAVIAQFDDNAANYWRQERQRMQVRQNQNVRPAGRPVRSVEQRPTRLIRGAAPKKGFTRVVPQSSHPVEHPVVPGQPAPEQPVPAETLPVQEAIQPPSAPGVSPVNPAPATQQAVRPTDAGSAVAPAIRMVVMGDNVGQLLARGLEQAYVDSPQIAVSRQTRDSSGLANNRFFDWADASRKLLAGGEKVDIALMMLGSNDAQDIQDGKDRLRVRSDPWVKAYKSRIEAIVTQFRDKKIPLLWVGMPIMRGERLSAEMLAFNELYRDTVQKAGGIYIDIWEAFIDDRSRFTLFGPDINGQIVKLRTGDGVHFTPSGSRKLAYFLESQLKRLIDERRPRTDPVIAAIAPLPAVATPAAKPAASELAAAPVAPSDTPAVAPSANPVVAALPPIAPVPKPIAAPLRPAAGPVVRLTAPELAPDGLLVSGRRKANAEPVQSAFVQRSLVEGTPVESQPGRADDFSWPRR